MKSIDRVLMLEFSRSAVCLQTVEEEEQQVVVDLGVLVVGEG
jgi:hypothetical protein